MTDTPKPRGGAREGAGRPATGQGKRMELYCRPDIFERLTDHALELDTSKSALVMQILDDYFAKLELNRI